MKLIVGMTGASGSIYGIRLLEELQKLGIETSLILTDWAKKTIEFETQYSISHIESLATNVYDNADLSAPIASGSVITQGMVILPCSMKTLSGIASGFADNLVIRAADVMLKERRKLLLVVRETPYNLIHIENMKTVTLAGALVMPPIPSFYSKPNSIDDIVNHTVGRILDNFGVGEHGLVKRWKEQ